jgi:hypothetical protein
MQRSSVPHQTHIDTSTLVLDQDLRDRIAALCSAPDENGHTIYREGVTAWAAHIEAFTTSGEKVATSVLRVVLALTGVHVPDHQEVTHTCGHTSNSVGLCVNPDHLCKQSREAAKRDKARRRHQSSLRQLRRTA